MAITALPTPPSRDDPTNFSTRADAFLGALPDFATEANALAVDVNADAVAAAAAEVAATAAASAATAAANVTKWVSGTTYAEGVVVWSPITYLSYRRKTAGAGTTDPSADSTNWAQAAGTGSQEQLVSGTNIKTINGGSVLGSGDLAVGGGSLIFISSVTASAASTVSFTSGINSTYDDYIVEVSNLGLTSSNRLVFQVSTDNGANWIAGASDYFSNSGYVFAGTIGGGQASADNGSVTNDVYRLSSVLASHVSFRLCNVNATVTHRQFITTGAIRSNQGSVRDVSTCALAISTAAINAVRFFAHAGAAITGTFCLYGIKRS